MIKWIIQDSKRSLKQRKTIILLLVIIASIFAIFYMDQVPKELYDPYGNPIVYEEKEETEYEIMIYNQRVAQSLVSNYFPDGCYGDQERPDDLDCSQFDIYHDNPSYDIEMVNDLPIFDMDEAWDYYLIPNAVYFKAIDDYINSKDEEYQDTIKSRLIQYDNIMEKSQEILKNLPEGFTLYSIETGVVSVNEFNAHAMSFLDYHFIYENDLPINATQILTGSFFIAKYLDAFSSLLILIGLIMIFDSFYLDYKSGVIKTILTSPTRRFRYLILKTLSAILSLIILIAGPILITVLILYFINGFDTFGLPIYISRTSLNSFEPVKKYSLVINDEMSSMAYSTYKVSCYYGPVTQYVQDGSSSPFLGDVSCTIQPGSFSSITLLNYIILCFAYLLLVIVLFASLNSLLSITFNNSIINLIILILLVVGGVVLSFIYIGNPILNYLPTSFLSPTQLIMGTVPFTYLHGLVVLSIYTVIINILNFLRIKRKDFAY